ncbi:MAG: hypothetical protein COY82_00215 [Parcubacteria group bacterium CG_4_10_14_0_8_um_filter_35_7]|nr:MAG: hypothetical protein COY82_00215 [Parcubacteria group bacterium CG_4_10_14_0_8_um_filter_35_7]
MKPKVIGTGNKDSYTYFIFRKDQQLLFLLRQLLHKQTPWYESVEGMVYKNFETPEEIPEEDLVEHNINNMVDEIYNFSGEDHMIDIIFGTSKVFMICTMSQEKTQQLRAFIRDNCSFR